VVGAGEIPQEVAGQLHPAYPRLQPLLAVLAKDPRQVLFTDSLAVGLYLAGVRISRAALTQLLWHSTRKGVVSREGRGRYAITEKGREFLQSLSI